MKKIISIICIATMLISSIVMPINIKASNDKLFEVTAESNINNITLRWKKQEGVSYYKVYRDERNGYHETPRKKEYKEIAELSSNNTVYVDKNVKTKIKYYYVVEGYEEKSGKDKLVCTTYIDWDPLIVAKRLDIPEIRGSGYSRKKTRLKIHIDYGYGMQPTGVEVYRKEEGKKRYKKIKVKKIGKNKVADENCKRGKVYKYKVITYIKVGKKKYYSKRSNILKTDTANRKAKYNIRLLNEKEKNTSTLTFKVKSVDKYSGNTFFYPGGGLFFYRDIESDKQGRYNVKLTKYSLDNKKWKKIPKKGVVLKAKKTVYLKCDIYKDDFKELTNLYIGENKPYESLLRLGASEQGDSLDYIYPEFYSEGEFDFAKGKGRVWQAGES